MTDEVIDNYLLDQYIQIVDNFELDEIKIYSMKDLKSCLTSKLRMFREYFEQVNNKFN